MKNGALGEGLMFLGLDLGGLEGVRAGREVVVGDVFAGEGGEGVAGLIGSP